MSAGMSGMEDRFAENAKGKIALAVELATRKPRKDHILDLVARIVTTAVIFAVVSLVVGIYLRFWIVEPIRTGLFHAWVAFLALAVWGFKRRYDC